MYMEMYIANEMLRIHRTYIERHRKRETLRDKHTHYVFKHQHSHKNNLLKSLINKFGVSVKF